MASDDDPQAPGPPEEGLLEELNDRFFALAVGALHTLRAIDPGAAKRVVQDLMLDLLRRGYQPVAGADRDYPAAAWAPRDTPTE